MTCEPAFSLYLLRHAHSSSASAGERDHSRRLDDKGRLQLERLRGELAGKVSDLRHAVCSGAARARETLEGIRAVLPADLTVTFDDDLYALGAEAYRSAARRALPQGPTLLVGHNPTIEAFARSLLWNDAAGLARAERGYGTAHWASIRVGADADGLPDLAEARLREWIAP